MEYCADYSVREWLQKAADAGAGDQRPTSLQHNGDPDNWTEIDLEYSSPEEVSLGSLV